ncbi:MAG: Hsp33 family molecular chaperone HslO [Burkholderiales bacterium]|nr:Hsp33 family molecular chaperone HslO [Burkholderiales bacterium]MDE2289112.1 Hsp33 family molecular chaperone HslO [Burkholderiales bacterium]
MSDQLKKFVFDAAPVRGEIVNLRTTWQTVLQNHDYPAPVRTLLGEMMAAAALLSANLKFDGALIMQIHGDGPVQMLVVECNSDLTMRATAKYSTELPADPTLAQMVNASGNGRFAITLDPHDKRPGQQAYQGIVPLADEDGPLDDMAAVLRHYMLHSEQLDTHLWLAADEQQAVGVMLQRLPGDGAGDARAVAQEAEDTWERACHLGATLKREELLSVSADDLLHRLFWQEDVRVFEPQPTRFRCTCSRRGVGNMLRMLGWEEVKSILDEREKIDIDCEFCRQHYTFDAVDATQLFAGDRLSADVTAAPSQRH